MRSTFAPPSLEIDQGPVRVRQFVFLNLGLERDLGRRAEKFTDIGPRDVGDALDLLLQPEMRGVIEPQERVLCRRPPCGLR